MEKAQAKNLTVEQFKSFSQPDIWASLTNIKSGTFMDCHRKIFSETGIWIEELVPVFMKLDAQLNKK